MATSDSQPIVIVTGGNRGIGLEICRQLAARGAQVILTARSRESGEKAAAQLDGAVDFQPLDVADPTSVSALKDYVQRTYGRLDVLINNAGIMPDADGAGLEVDLDTVRETLETNTLAPLHLAQTFSPLLRQSAAGRIVNISSGLGTLADMTGGHASYRISKTALNAVTRILAGELHGIAVNSVCPGWVRTDMGGASAERDVSQGADTPVWLALEAPQNLSGHFLRDRQDVAW